MGRGSGGKYDAGGGRFVDYRSPEGQAKSTQDLVDFLKSIGASAADPFQVPSYLVGTVAPDARDAWRDAQSEGPLGPLGNILGGFAAPVGTMATAAKNAIAAAPKVAGGAIAGWGLLSDPDQTDAEPRRNSKAKAATQEDLERDMDPLFRAVRGNPALEARYQQMQDAKRRSTSAVKGVNRESSDKVRSEAAAEAQRLNNEIVAELERLNPPKMAFEDAYPTASQNLPLVAALGGVGIGALLKGARSAGSFVSNKPWYGALDDAKSAIKADDPATAYDAAMKAQAFKKAEMSPATWAKVGGEVLPPLAGGVVGAEVAAYPHQYNLRNAPQDSAEYAAAEKAMGPDMYTTLGRGAFMGALGGLTGNHMPFPRSRAPIPETDALLARLGPGYSDDAQAMANSMRPVTIPGPRPLPPDPPSPTGGAGGGPIQGGQGGGPNIPPAPPDGPPPGFPPNVGKVQNLRGQAYAGAPKDMAQATFSRFLDDVPPDARSGYTPDVRTLLAQIQDNLSAAGLRSPSNLPSRAQASIDRFNVIKDAGGDPFSPAGRAGMINRKDTLALPFMAGGAGLLSFDDEQPTQGLLSEDEIMTLMAMQSAGLLSF